MIYWLIPIWEHIQSLSLFIICVALFIMAINIYDHYKDK